MNLSCHACAVCYVCSDERPPLYRVCACDMLVHEACLRDVVSRVPAHADRCAVCTVPYNVERTVVKRRRVDEPILCIIDALAATALFFSAVGASFRWAHGHPVEQALLVASLFVAPPASVASLGLHLLHRHRTGRWCCVYRETCVTGARIVLPAPVTTV